MEARIDGPGYRLLVVEGLAPVTWEEGEGLAIIRAPRIALELDAYLGVLGEAVAGLLLPPVRVEGPGWLERIVEDYRSRVVAEQAADMVVRLGRLALEARLRPSALPVSRMTLYWGVNGCLYGKALDPDALDEEYRGYAELVGSLEGGYLHLRPARYRRVLQAAASRIRALAARGVARLASSLAPRGPWPGSRCDPGQPPEPGDLMVLPEGRAFYNCPGGRWLAERILGENVECVRPGWQYSSMVCSGGAGRIVVKEYYRMIVKWLPAALASAPYYGYILSPKKRLYNEYRHILALRGLVGTPRILGVCGDQARAVMAREYVEGRPVLESRDPRDWEASGVALARIHNGGYALGDPNPGNFLVGPRGVSVIDVEQAKKYTVERGAWDLAVYTVYALLFNSPEELVSSGLRAYAAHASPLAEGEARILASRGFWATLAALGPVAARARSLLLSSLGYR